VVVACGVLWVLFGAVLMFERRVYRGRPLYTRIFEHLRAKLNIFRPKVTVPVQPYKDTLQLINYTAPLWREDLLHALKYVTELTLVAGDPDLQALLNDPELRQLVADRLSDVVRRTMEVSNDADRRSLVDEIREDVAQLPSLPAV
jgi:hypothetical protein